MDFCKKTGVEFEDFLNKDGDVDIKIFVSDDKLIDNINKEITNLKNKKSCGTNIEQCEYDFVYMNDNIWKPYEDTLQFLKEYIITVISSIPSQLLLTLKLNLVLIQAHIKYYQLI